MNPADFLARLQTAQSEAERDWLLMQFNLASQPAIVQQAVWTAAIPHWFDQPLLTALLAADGVGLDAAAWQSLLALSYVEPFAERGYNIHERTRSLLLDHLWQTDRERYQELSRRAAAYCATQDQAETHWRTETIYHQLLGNVPDAVDEFSSQGVDWYNEFAYDKVEALIRPVLEAVRAGRLGGNAAAWAYYRQGRLDVTYNRYAAARLSLETALALIMNNQTLKANCLKALGDVHLQVDEYAAARERYGEALPLYREIGSRLGAANCLKALGDVHRMVAEYAAARERYGEALPLYREIGARLGEHNIYLGLADLDREDEDWAAASAGYQRALLYYQEIGMAFNIALAYQRLGHTAKGAGDRATARQHYQAALALFTRIGSPMAQEVQRELDGLAEAESTSDEQTA